MLVPEVLQPRNDIVVLEFFDWLSLHVRITPVGCIAYWMVKQGVFMARQPVGCC